MTFPEGSLAKILILLFFFENFDRMIFQSHPKNLHPKNLLKLFIIIHLYRIVSVQRVTIFEIEASRHKKIHRKQVFLAKYWLIQSVYHTEKDLFHINEYVNYVLKTVIMCSMMYSKFVTLMWMIQIQTHRSRGKYQNMKNIRTFLCTYAYSAKLPQQKYFQKL